MNRDGGKGEDTSDKGGAGTERRRAAHLPEDVAGLGVTGESDPAARRRDEGRSGLKDEYRVRVAVTVQGNCARQAHVRGGFVDTGSERPAAEVRLHDGDRSPAGSVVVGGRQIGFRLQRNSVRAVLGAVDDFAGREPGDGIAWVDADAPGDDRRTGVRDGRAGEHGKGLGSTESYWTDSPEGCRGEREDCHCGHHGC